jgi:hypothetical protein
VPGCWASPGSSTSASLLDRLGTLHCRLRAAGGRLVRGSVGERAYEVLAVTRLTEVLDVRRAAGP